MADELDVMEEAIIAALETHEVEAVLAAITDTLDAVVKSEELPAGEIGLLGEYVAKASAALPARETDEEPVEGEDDGS